MLKRELGRIVFISSVSKAMGTSNYGLYCLHKAAIEGFILNIAVDYAERDLAIGGFRFVAGELLSNGSVADMISVQAGGSRLPYWQNKDPGKGDLSRFSAACLPPQIPSCGNLSVWNRRIIDSSRDGITQKRRIIHPDGSMFLFQPQQPAAELSGLITISRESEEDTMNSIPQGSMTIRIHPLRPKEMSFDLEPDPNVLLAQAQVKGDSGNLDVYDPTFREKFHTLFETPLKMRGDACRTLQPWSKEALSQIISFELARFACGAIVLPH
jgi:hypothetical protein